MAGASVGMPSELLGFYSNPAVLGYLDTWQAAAGYRSLVLDMWSGLVAFGLPVRNTGYWALSVLNLSEGDIDEVTMDNFGNPYETGRVWGGNQVAGALSWSRLLLKTLSLGVSLKGAYHYLGTDGEYYSADGLALDIGIQYRLMGERLVLGAVGRNIGFVRSGYSEDLNKGMLPIGVAGGVSYVPKYVKPLRIALDVEKTYGAYVDIQPGIEVSVLKDMLFLRAGYAFSESELSYAFDVLAGEEEEHVKGQWNRLCLGMGVAVNVREVRVGMDAALELNAVSDPSMAVTVLAAF